MPGLWRMLCDLKLPLLVQNFKVSRKEWKQTWGYGGPWLRISSEAKLLYFLENPDYHDADATPNVKYFLFQSSSKLTLRTPWMESNQWILRHFSLYLEIKRNWAHFGNFLIFLTPMQRSKSRHFEANLPLQLQSSRLTLWWRKPYLEVTVKQRHELLLAFFESLGLSRFWCDEEKWQSFEEMAGHKIKAFKWYLEEKSRTSRSGEKKPVFETLLNFLALWVY